MHAANAFTIRPVNRDDESRWRELFHAYRDFYRLAADERVEARVWDWLIDAGHETQGLVALRGDEIVGIAHYRRFARPSTGTVGVWLDDLFTDPKARGQGVGRALIERLQEIAGDADCSVVRWITASENRRAQGLYDQIATRTHWVTYDAVPTGSPA